MPPLPKASPSSSARFTWSLHLLSVGAGPQPQGGTNVWCDSCSFSPHETKLELVSSWGHIHTWFFPPLNPASLPPLLLKKFP